MDRIAARSGRGIIVLEASDVWAFEARERLCFVHSAHGRFDVDASLVELEHDLGPAFLRVHRSWLVRLANVRVYDCRGRAHWLQVGRGLGQREPAVRIPVARELASLVRARLLAGTIGYPPRSAPATRAQPLHPVST
jgi:DNA-binding LytR/AlgR family response regulator